MEPQETVVKEIKVGDKEKKEDTTYIINKVSYEEVCDMVNLKAGLKNLKNKSPGIDNIIKKNIDQKRLEKLQKDLKKQKYKPKPTRRIPISKSGGGVRYLSIASAIDKVVQSVLVRLLTPSLENIFYKNSYGYRPKKGCHDALKEIKFRWQNVT